MIKSKLVKLPQLKIIVLGFSEFRTLIASGSSQKSLLESLHESESDSYISSVYNPLLFKRMGGINGLNKIFKNFFDTAAQDQTLANIYRIKIDDPLAIENLRRKYVYMLGSMMGDHNMWQGGDLA